MSNVAINTSCRSKKRSRYLPGHKSKSNRWLFDASKQIFSGPLTQPWQLLSTRISRPLNRTIKIKLQMLTSFATDGEVWWPVIIFRECWCHCQRGHARSSPPPGCTHTTCMWLPKFCSCRAPLTHVGALKLTDICSGQTEIIHSMHFFFTHAWKSIILIW